MTRYIDPPHGWRYGFPKVLPEGIKDITMWLLENGYPSEEIDYWKNSSMKYIPIRMWEEE